MSQNNTFSHTLSKLTKFFAHSLVVGICVLIANGIYDEYKETDKQKNEVIERRLSNFYYPLLSAINASGNEWKHFRKHYGANRSSYFGGVVTIVDANGKKYYLTDCYGLKTNKISVTGKLASSKINELTGKRESTYEFDVIKEGCPVSEKELRAWRLQMKGTFRPFHERWEKIILGNRHLIGNDKEMNEIIDSLMLHVSGYKMAFSKWAVGDYSQMTSHNNFPAGIANQLSKRILKLEGQLK